MSSTDKPLVYMTMTIDDAELVMSALMWMAEAYAEQSEGDDEAREISIAAGFIAATISTVMSDGELRH